MDTNKAVRISGIEFANASEALQHVEAGGRGVAVLVGGRHLVVEQAEADRMAAAGVHFAYLVDHELPDGTRRVMTVPVND